MFLADGSSAEPVDPARVPYNAVGFPIPSYLTIGSALLAAGGLIATFFTDLPRLLALFLFGPFVFVFVAGFLYSVIRAAVHAGLRMDAYDAYLDEQVEADHAAARAGYLSPERAAQIAAETA